MERIPPQAIEVEESVLGAMLIEKGALLAAMDILSVDDFYKNGDIFAAMCELHYDGNPVDLLTVEETLKDNGKLDKVGGSTYLADLTRSMSSAANIEYHAQILREKALLRKAISDCTKIISRAYEAGADAYDVIDELGRAADGADGGAKGNHSLTPTEIFRREENTPKAQRLFTGFAKLDNGIYANSGMVKGQVNLTIADSGHGKTAYALWICEMLLKQGYKVHWFQLEDYDVNTASHFGRNVPEQMDNIQVCDSLYDIEAIKREARIVNRERGTDYIVLDYVQNITSASKQSKTEQVEYISQQITRMAKDLNVVCHPLSQVTMNYNSRNGWKQEPGYGDVRWSQQLKQDAHIITSVFRPSKLEELVESNGLTNKVKDWNGNLQPFDSVYVRQAKVRGGRQEYNRLQLIHGEYGLKPYTETRAERSPF